MKLTVHDIEHIAGLARLALSDSEKEMYAEQLSVVFHSVEKLNEVNTDSVQETTQVTGLEDVFREDAAITCDEHTRNKIREQFPEQGRRLLKVRAVFKNENEKE